MLVAMRNLTPRQQQIMDLIRLAQRETGMPPTRADISQHFNFRSPTAADDHLKALEKKGVIQLLPGKSRGIRILDDATYQGIPVIGRVAAGEPILAQQHIEDHYEIDANRFTPRADYLLSVCGHSMRDAGILDGDLLAVSQIHEAGNGQIVVARVEDEVTVTRFHRKGDTVTLLPENPDFNPIKINLRTTTFAIEGLGVGVIRDKGL